MTTVHLNALRLDGIVGADRKLTVQLPPEVPDGPVELVVLLPKGPASFRETNHLNASEWERKTAELRARVKLAGKEGSIQFPNPHARLAPLSDAQLLEIGKLLPDARPSHELIQEDREDRI